jgi:hypothetical protein
MPFLAVGGLACSVCGVAIFASQGTSQLTEITGLLTSVTGLVAAVSALVLGFMRRRTSMDDLIQEEVERQMAEHRRTGGRRHYDPADEG